MAQWNKKLLTCRRSEVQNRVWQVIFLRNPVNAVKKNFTTKNRKNSPHSTLKDLGTLRWKKVFSPLFTAYDFNQTSTRGFGGTCMEEIGYLTQKLITQNSWSQRLLRIELSKSFSLTFAVFEFFLLAIQATYFNGKTFYFRSRKDQRSIVIAFLTVEFHSTPEKLEIKEIRILLPREKW